MAFLMALIESTRAKMRFFQLPSLLGGAFVLALLSLLTFYNDGKMKEKSKLLTKTQWQRFKGTKKDFNLVFLCLCPLVTILHFNF